MKFLKPIWVNHEGNSIFSIDVHPDGSRFATGGQGNNSGRITIWNFSPLYNKEDEFNENVPKMLCQLDNHLSCVNTLRWSNNGKYLASAGDDKIIMIWKFAGQGGITFGGSSNAESWRACNTLRGHSGDILDLNWSPNDIWLATCSVDNTVRIWNVDNFPECIKIITGHQGFVKGVSWDPMGKYLSTQSDDKTLKIWRVSDWKEEVSITKPFADCGGTTHVLRLNWCPDGQLLVSAHAMNNLGSTAQIITRKDWKTDKDFVGHRKAVTCVRFNPKVFYKVKKDKKFKFFSVAIGSRDRTLSVWLTNRKRPLFVMHDLFDDSVMDISWSHDGFKLLTCSWDGTIAYFEFTEEELGKVLDDDETSVYLHKLYGKNMISMSKKNNSALFVEDAELLKIRENNESKKLLLTQNGNTSLSRSNMSENTNFSTKLSKGSTDKQIEFRTSDGRRRITPLYIPPVTNGDGMPIPFNANQQTTFGTSNRISSKIQIEKIDSVQSISLLSNPSPENKKTSSNDDQIEKQKYKEKSEKKDSPVSSNEEFSKKNQTPKPQHVLQQKNNSTNCKSNNNLVLSNLDKNKTKKIEVSSILLNNKPNLPEVTPKVLEKRISEKHYKDKTDHKNFFANLYTLKIEKTFTVKIKNKIEQYENCSLIVENCINNLNLCSLKLIDVEHNKIWQVLVCSKISAISNSDDIVSICCEDYSVHIFTLKTGKRLSSPLILNALVSKMCCKNYLLLIITNKSELWLWDMKSQKVLVKKVTLLPLLHNNNNLQDINITNYNISQSNLPMISLSTGKTYLYDLNLETWKLISNTQDLLSYSCDYKPVIDFNSNDYPLTLLQSQQRLLRQTHNLFLSNTNLQSKATLSYIDQQISSSLILNSSKEYRYWLIVLAQHLTSEGLEERFRELCEFLLGPTYASSFSDWSDSILGLNKRDLLQEVLLISTRNLKFQRIYNEFKEQLDLAKS